LKSHLHDILAILPASRSSLACPFSKHRPPVPLGHQPVSAGATFDQEDPKRRAYYTKLLSFIVELGLQIGVSQAYFRKLLAAL